MSDDTDKNLWLCYHALKVSEWEYAFLSELSDVVVHRCAYCGNSQNTGHDKSCMIDNALDGMAKDFSALPAERSLEQIARERFEAGHSQAKLPKDVNGCYCLGSTMDAWDEYWAGFQAATEYARKASAEREAK